MTTDSTTTSTGREATPVEVSQRQAIENERFRQRIAELEAELAVLRAERDALRRELDAMTGEL